MIRNSITSYTVYHQYSVPTIYQRFSRTSIFEESLEFQNLTIKRRLGMFSLHPHPYHLQNGEHSHRVGTRHSTCLLRLYSFCPKF